MIYNSIAWTKRAYFRKMFATKSTTGKNMLRNRLSMLFQFNAVRQVSPFYYIVNEYSLSVPYNVLKRRTSANSKSLLPEIGTKGSVGLGGWCSQPHCTRQYSELLPKINRNSCNQIMCSSAIFSIAPTMERVSSRVDL